MEMILGTPTASFIITVDAKATVHLVFAPFFYKKLLQPEHFVQSGLFKQIHIGRILRKLELQVLQQRLINDFDA